MPLVQHLTDSGDVAAHVWDWLPRRTQLSIEGALPEGARDGRTLLCWLAGVHDIGKASPPFASKVPVLAERMRSQGLVPPSDTTDFRLAPHGLVGQAVLERWLGERYGSRPRVARTYAVVVGGHHGVPPTYSKLSWLKDHPGLIGDERWHSTQDELLDAMAQRTGADRHLAVWSSHPLTPTCQALLTGAVIVSDWLASNTDLFPFEGLLESGQQGRAEWAWESLDLASPWRPTPMATDAQDVFERRFPGLGGSLRPVQHVAVSAAQHAAAPPLLIIEAGMGSGKTEAALLAAEVLAERFDCGGVFFGLPTMATTDGMFRRVLDWIGRLDGEGPTSTHLAHGKAGLNDDYRGLARHGELSRVYDEGADGGQAQAAVQAWLTGRKKGVLATMVVGTIDQLLFMALQAKHAALRHLAFAGKVVVVDEVHAADDFMRMFLCRALEWLAAYGVPVILLSATLPSAQRQELADAYRAGLGLGPEPLPDASAYPLITTVASTGTSAAGPTSMPPSTTIAVRAMADDMEALGDLLADWLVDGGCVAVIRNSVSRAQETASFLRERFGNDVVVLHHSRFIASHRAIREAVLRAELGPGDARRPAQRIAVGTQVLEQSLDVDFDAVVTDLAPIDLLLQRSGRLHRHPRERPVRLRDPELVICGIQEWVDGVPAPDRGTRAVYGLSRLLRAAGALGLREAVTIRIEVPADIRRLVEAAYDAEPPVPVGWLDQARAADMAYRAKLIEARGRADNFRMEAPDCLDGSLMNWLEDSSTEAEDGTSQGSGRVRDSEDGIEVVVTQREEGEVRFIDDGSAFARRPLPTGLGAPDPDVARALASTTVRLPLAMTRRGSDFDRTLAALEANAYEGWQQSPWLSGQLVLHLDEHWRATVGAFCLSYDLDDGLMVYREES